MPTTGYLEVARVIEKLSVINEVNAVEFDRYKDRIRLVTDSDKRNDDFEATILLQKVHVKCNGIVAKLQTSHRLASVKYLQED